MQWEINQDIDIRHGALGVRVWPNALMITGDNEAHIWKIRLLESGRAAVAAGTVTAYFVRPDKNTVMVAGTLEDNVASVVLPQAVYAQEGNLQAIMRLTAAGGQVVTLSALILPVRQMLTDSIIDPGEVIPSLDDLLAQIDAMEQATGDAIAAAQDALNGIITSVTISGHNLTFTTAGGTTYTIIDAMKGVHDAAGAANDAAGTANTAAQSADNARTSLITEVGEALESIPAEVTDQINTRLGGLSLSVDPADKGLNITYTY